MKDYYVDSIVGGLKKKQNLRCHWLHLLNVYREHEILSREKTPSNIVN